MQPGVVTSPVSVLVMRTSTRPAPLPCPKQRGHWTRIRSGGSAAASAWLYQVGVASSSRTGRFFGFHGTGNFSGCARTVWMVSIALQSDQLAVDANNLAGGGIFVCAHLGAILRDERRHTGRGKSFADAQLVYLAHPAPPLAEHFHVASGRVAPRGKDGDIGAAFGLCGCSLLWVRSSLFL